MLFENGYRLDNKIMHNKSFTTLLLGRGKRQLDVLKHITAIVLVLISVVLPHVAGIVPSQPIVVSPNT